VVANHFLDATGVVVHNMVESLAAKGTNRDDDVFSADYPLGVGHQQSEEGNERFTLSAHHHLSHSNTVHAKPHLSTGIRNAS